MAGLKMEHEVVHVKENPNQYVIIASSLVEP
jgi:hypothetical protein